MSNLTNYSRINRKQKEQFSDLSNCELRDTSLEVFATATAYSDVNAKAIVFHPRIQDERINRHLIKIVSDRVPI